MTPSALLRWIQGPFDIKILILRAKAKIKVFSIPNGRVAPPRSPARPRGGVTRSGLVVEGGRGAELLPRIDFGPLGVEGLAEGVERVLAEQEQTRPVG